MESGRGSATFGVAQVRLRHVFALLCALALVYKLAAMWLRRQETLRAMDAFPGPSAHWLLGHNWQFKRDGSDFDLLMTWARQYPHAFPVKFGPSICFLNIHHPDYAKTMVNSTEPKDDLAYRFIMPWIGRGLLVSNGGTWFGHRRLLTPGFHFDILKPYLKLMSDSAETMLEKWEVHAKTNESFDISHCVSLMTLDAIMKCAFSHTSDCQTKGGMNTYIEAVYELTRLIAVRLRYFPYHNDLIFHLSPHGFKFRQMCRIAHRHTEEVIRRRSGELKEEKELNQKLVKRNRDFLDILLCARDENEQGLSDEEIRAEVDTFMFRGHDTTASGVSFLLYCMACHPEHQQRCRDEILDVLQGRDTLEWGDLNNIPYTTMCIKECLRLYPPVPAISRITTKPMTFFDGRTVPAGTFVGTTIYGLHRNSDVWENPGDFDPLRFLPENVSKRSPYAFLPFSSASRNCIGQNFAMNELKVVLAKTLKRYHLMEEPTFKPKLIPKLVLRSINGIQIKIRPVDP